MSRRLLTAALRWLLYPEGHPEFCASYNQKARDIVNGMPDGTLSSPK
jgi:hypothetical protein